MTLYLAVTADEYELPLYVADSCKEMAKWFGVDGDWISSAICRYNRRRGKSPDQRKEVNYPGKTRFCRIEVDD